MKVKCDHRSKFSNLSNWNPWPPRYRCDALPTELWSHTLGAWYKYELFHINFTSLPYISYGLAAWGLASKSYLKKILVLQKRALRFIFFAVRCEHAVPFFIHAHILPLNFLYFKSVCCLIHDVRNRKVPNNILNLFSDTASIHSYNTRSSSANKFYIKKSRLEI